METGFLPTQNVGMEKPVFFVPIYSIIISRNLRPVSRRYLNGAYGISAWCTHGLISQSGNMMGTHEKSICFLLENAGLAIQYRLCLAYGVISKLTGIVCTAVYNDSMQVWHGQKKLRIFAQII